jgi:hypothetical protein
MTYGKKQEQAVTQPTAVMALLFREYLIVMKKDCHQRQHAEG